MEYFPYDFSKGFEALIISAIEAGQIDQRFTPKFVVTTLQLLFSNVHKYITPGKSSDEVIDIVNQMIDLMQHGISSKNGG
ncbi:MAG: hypothetical protein EWM47_13035 [Anaerolineaceae bacterium]|nr:MAG: hypothetical protein EWM47_13035 [Anaerolineaceae bacterium]